MEVGTTHRGFKYNKFRDRNNEQCSIQKSSVATESCIWLGIDDADPIIMASYAKENGVDTQETTGWVKYPIPDEVSLTTRMHLTQEQVLELLPLLTKFAETGEL